MNARPRAFYGLTVAFCLLVLSGQACPPNGDGAMPAPAPIPGPPGPPGDQGPPGPPGTDATVTAGDGVAVENGVVSLDTNFTDGLYWKLDGNGGTTTGTHFLGTTDAQALELRVNGARALRMEPTAGSPNVIGGSGDNVVEAGVVAATISGGGPSDPADPTTGNRVFDDFGTIGGGANNRTGNDDGDPTSFQFGAVGGGNGNIAGGLAATVAGGQGNSAAGNHTTVAGGKNNAAGSTHSFIGGGEGNSTAGQWAFLGAGRNNQSNGSRSSILGGENNRITGGFGAVLGGSDCEVLAERGFALGRQAKIANVHPGAILFADNTAKDFESTFFNEFAVRASGGVRMVTAVDNDGVPTAGARLASGGSAWLTISDRNAKENFTKVDGRAILERLAAIPIETWNYKAQDASIRHMGPMAQTFRAAFGLGPDDKHISTLDADGVALAAIQGLNLELQERDARIAEQQARIEALETRMALLDQVLNRLMEPTGGKGPHKGAGAVSTAGR